MLISHGTIFHILSLLQYHPNSFILTISTVWFCCNYRISFYRITEHEVICQQRQVCKNPQHVSSLFAVILIILYVRCCYTETIYSICTDTGLGIPFFRLLFSFSSAQWAASGPLGHKPWLVAPCRFQLQLSDKDTPTPVRADDKKYNTANSLAAST